MALAEDLTFENHTGSTSGSAPHSPPHSAPHSAVPVDEIDEAVGLVVDVIGTLPRDEALLRSARYQSWFIALEASLFADNKADGASDRDNEKLAGRGSTTSKAEAKKKAKRGAAIEENPDLASDLTSGELGTEQLDAIASAASKTGGDAATSTDLIDTIKGSSPDDANKIAKNWVEEHNNPTNESTNAADARRERQRRRRSASRFETEDGMAAIIVKGDDESINEMWSAMTTASRKLWTKDGGRDLPAHKHPRSRKQRLFDAAHQAFTNGSTNGSQPTGPTSSPTASSGAQLHMWVSLEDVIAGNPSARFADGSLVPQTVLARYMCNGSIAGTVFDKFGEVIHHGRDHRYATPAQVRGLIARDKGCVLCSAPASECEAHHLLPWNAPLTGETNIDNMALVCTDCHHFIHNTLQTLFRNAKGSWCLRPATPGEIPPHQHGSGGRDPSCKTRPQRHQVRHE